MKKHVFLIGLLLGIVFISLIPISSATTYYLQVSFSSNPKVVAPGTTSYLELNLKNVGSGTIHNIEPTVVSWDRSVIQAKGNWNVDIGDLDSGESTTVIYEFTIASTAPVGLYQVVFEVSYSAGTVRQTLFIKVGDSSALDIVSVTPSSINIGQKTTVVFNVTNNGGSTASNILFTWDDTNDLILPIGADNRIGIDSIPGENYSNIPVDMMASPSISPGVYPISITIEYYEDTGSEQTITSEVGIQVSGGTDFELVLQSSTSGTTFAVANTGANTASSVIVSIPTQLSYSVTGASSVSLGNLEAGDYTLATFQITSSAMNTSQNRPSFNRTWVEMPSDFDPSLMDERIRNRTDFNDFSPGGTNLIVEISYTDLFGLRQTVQKEVAVTSLSSTISTTDLSNRFASLRNENTLSGQSSGIDGGTMYIIIGVIGIIVIVAILKIGKSKKFLKRLKGKEK